MEHIYTYIFIAGGYMLLSNGIPLVGQPFNPALPFIDGVKQPFATEAAALAHCMAEYPTATPAV